MKKEELELGIDYGISGIYHIVFDDGGRKPLLYIGESQCIKTRWKKHIWCLENDRYKRPLDNGNFKRKYIQNVYNKHGWEHFEFNVFEVMDGSTQKERHIREKYWIKELKTFNEANTYKGYGFNHRDGGGGVGCGADHLDAKPCEIEGVRYGCYTDVAKVYGVSRYSVCGRINSTSLRFKDWLGVDDNGNAIPKECIPTMFDKSEEDKYILEYNIKGVHVGWAVRIPFFDGKDKTIGTFNMDEKDIARAFRDYWLEHPNKSDFWDVVGEKLKDIFYNDNIDLIPNIDLTKGYSIDKKTNKYKSQIKINKKLYSLGLYTEPQEASKMHYFALYNYALNGILPIKGNAQKTLYLETKEKGSEHPIINNLFES